MKHLFACFFLGLPWMLSGQQVDFTANQVCLGQQTTLMATYVPGDSQVSQWMWDLDNDGQYDDAMGKTIYHLFAAGGSQAVSVKVIPLSGPADSMAAPKNVTVHPLPQVNYTVDNYCAGLAAVYTADASIASGSINQYLWDFNNDGSVDDNSGPVVSFNNGPAGNYLGKLECVSDRGCSSFAIKTAQVHPVPNASFTGPPVCLGEPTVLANQSSVSGGSIQLAIWNFGDGTQEVNSSSAVSHAYSSPQVYSVQLIVVSDQFCSDTTYGWPTVYALPNVSVHITGDSVLYDGAATKLTATGDAGTYLWSNGATTQSITVKKGGVYTVTVTNANGCAQSASQPIVVKTLEEVEVRNNIISPNGDQVNDVLFIEDLNAYDACEIHIYNIWGDVVYSRVKYQNNWSGTDQNGNLLDGGSYYYVLRCDDKEVKKGNVNILR